MNTEKPSAENVLVVTRSIRIPRDEFTFTFMRSSGPGGQNVNKVNTKVRLRWDVANSPSLSEAVRERFQKTYSRRITTEGDLLITSQRYRDQARNIEDCLEKLRELLATVASPPQRRKKTRPSRASKERRLKQKRQQSDRKRNRKKPTRDD